MIEAKERLTDLFRGYLACTRALRSAAERGDADAIFSLLKDREELKATIDAVKRYTKIGEREAQELLPLLVATEEAEKEISPILRELFAKEKSLFLGLKGYAAATLPRTDLIDIST